MRRHVPVWRASPGPGLDGRLRSGGQYEIGRLGEQFPFQLGDASADECDHVVGLLAAGDCFWVVGYDPAVR